jgi:hypothetical protein
MEFIFTPEVIDLAQWFDGIARLIQSPVVPCQGYKSREFSQEHNDS